MYQLQALARPRQDLHCIVYYVHADAAEYSQIHPHAADGLLASTCMYSRVFLNLWLHGTVGQYTILYMHLHTQAFLRNSHVIFLPHFLSPLI